MGSFFVFGAGRADAATYTVCSSGCDQTTIQGAFDNYDLEPGDIVEVRADTEGGTKAYREAIIWGSDDFGSSDLPVTLKARVGDSIILSGATSLNSGWGVTGVNGEYEIAGPSGVDGGNSDGRFILMKTGVIVSAKADNSNGSLTSGYWCLGTSTNPDTIYYKPLDGESIEEQSFELGQNNIIDLNGVDNITIDGINFYGAANGIFDDTNGDNRPTNVTVENCTFINMAGHGIYLYAGENITVGDNIGLASDSLYSNKFQYCQKGAVKLGSSTGGISENQDCNNCTVQSNYFFQNAYADVSYSFEGHQIDFQVFSDNVSMKYNFFKENGYINNQPYTDTLSSGSNTSVDGVDNFTISRNHYIDNYNGCIVFGPSADNASAEGNITGNIFNNNGRALVGLASRLHLLRVIKSVNNCGQSANVDALIANNTFYENKGSGGVYDNGAASIFLDGNSALSGISVKNNIALNNSNLMDLRIDTQQVSYSENNNNWYRVSGGNYLVLDDNTTELSYPQSNNFNDFKARSGGSYSLNADPLIVSSSNLNLQSTSPAIDAGTDVSLTTDYAGNPIYGLPDIGAYEYQPPQDMVGAGKDEIDIGAGARIYQDGKFRNLGTASSVTADLTITPESGAFTSYGATETRPSWLDITAITWNNTGVHEKQWTESNSTPGLTNTVHTVGDLEANKYYNVTVDDVIANLTGANCSTIGSNYVCQANSQGKITFTYIGSYSDHTFDVTEGDNTAPAITRTAPDTELDWDTRETHLEITTDENATCRYAKESSKTYSQMTDTFDTTGTTTHQTKINDLTHNSSYTYYVRCIDPTTNANSSSTEISFSVEGIPELKIDKIKTQTSQTQIKIRYDTTRNTDTFVKYGLDKDNLLWEAKKEGKTKDHSLTINDLKPDTRYYFKIKAEDRYGEEASETLSATTEKETLASYLFPEDTKLKEDNNDKKEQTITENITQKVQETKQELDNFFTSKIQKTNDQIILAQAQFRIVDKNDQPIPNLEVTLHSDPQETTTDELGIATFKDVPTGKHTLTFAYDNDSFEKRVAISDPKTNTDTIKAEIVTVRAEKDGVSWWMMLLIVALGGGMGWFGKSIFIKNKVNAG